MSPDALANGNVRVFVRWDDQTVFSGEEIKCRITFRNVAPAPSPASASRATGQQPPSARQAASERARQSSPLHPSARPKPAGGLAPPLSTRGHRSTLSLTVPSSRSRHRADSTPWSPQNNAAPPPDVHGASNGHGHRRSISIVSLGSSIGAADGFAANAIGSGKSQRPLRGGHARASSLQIVSRVPLVNGPRSASHPHRSFTSQPSPLFNASYPPDKSAFRGRPSGAATAPNTPSVGGPRGSPRSGPDALSEFRFPMAQSPLSGTEGGPASGPLSADHLASPNPSPGEKASMPLRPRDAPVPTIHEGRNAPEPRILSTTSIAGTPRSSGEFYSLSNNSSETLASEYVTHQPQRSQQSRPPHMRQRSNLSPQKSKAPETLMMGYAQIQGSFTLDGSLVNLGPFEQVKRKAVVGGQGGGVIGLEPTRREGGLLRSFGWGNLTSSIGELLGSGELSSIKEMRGIASSKSVPLLSTPQSILFVDLQLAPGESRSFDYAFRLPKGLPPTHKGKAMKIVYSLVIGTQRPGGAKEQQVRSVEIPFRVLGSVNSHGEILGHDLMTPYILLRDQARVRSIDKSSAAQSSFDLQQNQGSREAPPATAATLNGFLSYVDELLNRMPQGSGGGLLSPTAMPSSRRPSAFEEAATAKEAIDLAILRSNMTAEGQQSANRFEIARNGRKVGAVMLARPWYRLGESVTMAVDFAGAEVPCYAVHAALETAERVEPTLALRSEASIQRVTRKVYVSSSEATLFARRIVFTPTIPVTATPEFVTSGVSLDWKIRLEFVVPAHDYNNNNNTLAEEDEASGQGGADDDDDDSDETPLGARQHGPGSAAAAHRRSYFHQAQFSSGPHPLLEEVSRDDRGGLVLVAAEDLVCESFEVAVPLRVYGAVTTGLERLERDEALEEGLIV